MIRKKLQKCHQASAGGLGICIDFDLAKLMEEVGDLAVEVQVMNGRIPKHKGSTDGVVGEAVDVALTALGIAYSAMLASGTMNLDDMERCINSVAMRKMKASDAQDKKIF